MSKAWMTAVAWVSLAVMVGTSTGCWPNKGPDFPNGEPGVGNGTFRPVGEGGIDYPQAERTPLGVPVTEQEFTSVQFGYDKYRIESVEQAKIDIVAGFMQQNDDVICVTEGHCDERGSREYNFSLGELRALAVRNYLISYGVAASRIQTRSYGEEMPVAMGHAEYDWGQNRRVDFALYRP